MKIDGLGDDRRTALSQICHLVEQFDEFSGDQFKKMVASYQKDDVTVFQILNEANQQAESNYTHYLNAKIMGTSGRYWPLEISSQDGAESPVLLKVMSELRERMKNEKEYRRDFLVPEIKQVSGIHDGSLRRVQKHELKRQREEMKSLAKVERRRSSGYGIGF